MVTQVSLIRDMSAIRRSVTKYSRISPMIVSSSTLGVHDSEAIPKSYAEITSSKSKPLRLATHYLVGLIVYLQIYH